jgi:hypothetical protein
MKTIKEVSFENYGLKLVETNEGYQVIQNFEGREIFGNVTKDLGVAMNTFDHYINRFQNILKEMN